MTLITRITRCIDDERGSTAVEYAGVMLLIAIVLVFSLAMGLDGLLSDVANEIAGSLP